MKPLVRLGMIGAGGVAQAKHLPSINRLRTIQEPVELVAIADPDEASGRKVAAQYATTWYPNHEAMLTQDGLDAIGIASPDTYHAAHAKACVESGKHVLVEKQIAADRGAAREMCHLVDARRLVLPTAFCIRYAEPYEQAKLLIQTRAIG